MTKWVVLFLMEWVKSFNFAGNAVSSSENRGNTKTSGSVDKYLATAGDDKRLEKYAREKLGPNASQEEVDDYVHSQKEIFNEDKSKLNPQEDAAMITSDMQAKKQYDEKNKLKTPEAKQGNPGHDNLIPDDSPFNFVDNAIDSTLDFASEWAAPVVGGVATAGLFYMAGERVAKAGKGTANGLKKATDKVRGIRNETTDNTKNGTNEHTTTQNNDSTGKSTSTHVKTSSLDIKNYTKDYVQSQESFNKESKNLNSLEKQKQKMMDDGKDTTAIDEKISDSKAKVNGFETEMRDANSNLKLSQQMAAKESGIPFKSDNGVPKTHEQLSQEFKEIGSQKKKIVTQYNSGKMPTPTMMSKASDFAEKALKTGGRVLEAATVLKKWNQGE